MRYFVEGLRQVHGGEGIVRSLGEYETLEGAIKAAESIIDEFLSRRFVGGMTISDLFSEYQKSGEVPFIFSDDDKTMNVNAFNHFKYAMLRCAALCGAEEKTKLEIRAEGVASS